jgi:hypothetical protein
MDVITMILIAIFFIPACISLVGIALLIKGDKKNKKIALLLILSGIGLAGVILLIGYSICSNIHLGNMN